MALVQKNRRQIRKKAKKEIQKQKAGTRSGMCLQNSLYERYIKRGIDVTLAVSGLAILWPVMAVTALLVRVKLGSPVIFRQKRPGKDEKIFEMYKFRTMTDARDKAGNLLPDEERLTSFGKKLRSTSLDELPELFNILKGDMSVVGPRPQLVRDMVFMTPRQRERHTVLPGLTGLAQVNGRNNISWEKKLDWDLQYLAHVSFRMDAAIVAKTVRKVLKKEDIAVDGMETAEDLGDYLLRKESLSKAEYDKKLEEAERMLIRWKG